MVHADYLFLLTDVDGLYLSNPRKDPDATFLEVVSSVAKARLEGRKPALHIVIPSLIHYSTGNASSSPRPFFSCSLSLSRLNRTQLTLKLTLHLLTCSSVRLSPASGLLCPGYPGTPK